MKRRGRKETRPRDDLVRGGQSEKERGEFSTLLCHITGKGLRDLTLVSVALSLRLLAHKLRLLT